MKKIINFILFISLSILTFVFVGCNNRYNNVYVYLAFSYSQNEVVEVLDNGNTRVKTSTSTFDIRPDGSYIVYIQDGKESKVDLKVTFENEPKDFTYKANVSSSVEIVNVSNSNLKIENGVIYSLSFYKEGETQITALNYDSGKSNSIFVEVVNVESNFNFINSNIALAKIDGLSINFNNEIDISSDLVTFDFGSFNDVNDFVLFTNELIENGLNYNTQTNTLTLLNSNILNLDNIVVRATYINPIGDNIVKYVTIDIIPTIENIEVYNGSSYTDAKNSLNRIDSSLDFVVTISGNNYDYRDIVLKVESNGENIVFDFVEDTLFPFEVLQPNKEVVYESEDNVVVDNYQNAKYTYVFYRLKSIKSTTTDEYVNNLYTLKISCNYQDYEVPTYPIYKEIQTKCYALIKNFWINDNGNSNVYLTFDKNNFSNFLNSYSDYFLNENVYTRTSDELNGKSFKIDVKDNSVLEENTSFTIEFYKDNSILVNPTYYFDIHYTDNEGNVLKINNDNELSTKIFNKGTTLYLKTTYDNVDSTNNVFYMIVRATKPDNISRQAVTVVKLNVVEGLESIDNFNYSYFSYKQDGNGDYEVGEDDQFIVEENISQNISFNNFIAQEEIELNYELHKNKYSIVNFSYTPQQASLENVKVFSSNDEIFEVDDSSLESGKIGIIVRSSGKADLIIKIDSILYEYVLPINIYTPVQEFNLYLMEDSYEDGVGQIVTEEFNTINAIVQNMKVFNLQTYIFPYNANNFETQYNLYRVEGENLINIGSYSLNSNQNYEIYDNDFYLNCISKSFRFLNDENVDRKYIIEVILINLNGSQIKRQIEISSYNRIESLNIFTNKVEINNPNNIYYLDKVQSIDDIINNSIDDPSVFNISVQDFGNPTFSFEDFATLEIWMQNIKLSEYSLQDGRLNQVYSIENNCISALSLDSFNNAYWFRLNENYSLQGASIVIKVYINEFNEIIQSQATISVSDLVEVSSIKSNSDEIIHLKQGINTSQTINLTVNNEEAYNKSILTKDLFMMNIDGNYYYVLEDESSNNYINSLITNNNINYTFNVEIAGLFFGQIVTIFMPEDKINSLNDYQDWNNYSYTQVDITQDDFISGLFYYNDNDKFVLEDEFNVNAQYFVRSVDFDKIINLFKETFFIQFVISDGENIPFYVTSFSDLQEINTNSNLANKNFILAKDISLQDINWQPIGNYYVVQLDQTSFEPDVYYIKQDSNYVIANEYDSEEVYYSYGFNGSLSGKYSILSADGSVIENYYKITNIKSNLTINNTYVGLFTNLGQDCVISDLILEFDAFQLSDKQLTRDLIFGGIAAVNYGKLENVEIKFNELRLTSNYNITFGGVVGLNYGYILNVNSNKSHILDGSIYVTSNNADASVIVGGYVGRNYGTIQGIYTDENDIQFSFVDQTSNLNLNINVETKNIGDNPTDKQMIGGVAGFSTGIIKGMVVEGNIVASNTNNVGGLVGFLTTSNQDEQNLNYSIQNSYSSLYVTGYSYVGGAIGRVEGFELNNVNIYNISSENYVTLYQSRTYIKGNNFVGGLIGYSNYAKIEYSYVVSYYDCNLLDLNSNKESVNYDIVGNEYVSSFIAYSLNNIINKSASYINIFGKAYTSAFISFNSDSQIDSIFYIGSIYCSTIQGEESFNNNSYYVIYDIDKNSISQSYSKDVVGDFWAVNDDINNGLPYLVFKDSKKILFATGKIKVDAFVKEVELSYTNYIKVNDHTLFLFYNYDSTNEYTIDVLDLLNTIHIQDFIDIDVNILTDKTSRFNLSSTNDKVISILDNGYLKINGIGRVTLTISSKLNSNYSVSLEVNVIYGISDIELYADTMLLDYEKEQEVLILKKSVNQNLDLDISYNRNIQNNDYNLQPNNNQIGVRFIIKNDDNLKNILNQVSQTSGSVDINSLLKMNADNLWILDQDYYYVDITNFNLYINPTLSFEGELSIYYIPYIVESYNNKNFLTLISSFENPKYFNIQIIDGAKEIIFENSVGSTVQINQIQNFVLTVTIMTDYEDEEIVTNLEILKAQDENFGCREGNLVKNYNVDGNIISVSKTYTFWYQDKVNSILEAKEYKISFWSNSRFSETTKKELVLRIEGYDKLDYISAQIYSDGESDFPHEQSINKIVYNNGKSAILALEVYPYFVDYSKIRISYTTSSAMSLSITQLKYNIQGTGDKFTINTDSGAYIDQNNNLIIEKSSAQDTYQFNTNGIYSYSKSYFFALLVSSSVPNNTVYNLKFEFINRLGQIIKEQSISFSTMTKSLLNLSFNQELKQNNSLYVNSNNEYYYLPFNTKHEIFVDTIVKYDYINWEVSSTDYDLNAVEKEALTPVFENNKWYVNVMNFGTSAVKTNTDLIGKTINLTATIDDSYPVDPCTITFVVTLFTITDISVLYEEDGYLLLENNTTNPLKVNVDVEYDLGLTSSSNNWYTTWYNTNKDNKEDSLYNNIVNAGYNVEQSILDYISFIEEKIAKTNYRPIESGNKQSGIFIYKSNLDGNDEYLTAGKLYNNGAFEVENYNNFIALSGLKDNVNTNLKLLVYLSYSVNSDNATSSGLANVENYNVTFSQNRNPFVFEKDFTVNFYNSINYQNSIPVSNAEEFLGMADANNDESYRLICDIYLENYSPINANMYNFDGNGFTIYITSFDTVLEEDETLVLGLFNNISEDTLISNLNVYYTRNVNIQNNTITNETNIKPVGDEIKVNINTPNTIYFGGMARINNGIITNCKLSGNINVSVLENYYANVNVGGFVYSNSETGYITYSKVEGFNITCYGSSGGFVAENRGKIVSCSFSQSSLKNLSVGNVGAFVLNNYAEIYESFTEGSRLESDVDIRNKGQGISSNGGKVGGFAYYNNSIINDCYSNISLSSSLDTAGFVYLDSASSVISRCYSICYNEVSLTSSGGYSSNAFPFVGPASEFLPKVVVNGNLINCYYLIGNESDWRSQIFYDSQTSEVATTNPNKKATGLSFDDFATHKSFINYDLSLVYSTDLYPNTISFNYVDGYTWVIIEGKPVLASSLVETFSQQRYIGKVKNYSANELRFYSSNDYNLVIGTPSQIGVGQNAITRVNYYADQSQQDLVFTTHTSDYFKTITFTFYSRNNFEELSIVCDIKFDEENQKNYLSARNAEYGNEVKKILDVMVEENGVITNVDSNFRANDTIVISFNQDKMLIENINYKELLSASYNYANYIPNISNLPGSRTNPEIIYDLTSFESKLSSNTEGKFYRLVSDIDLEKKFVSTIGTSFKGVLQGNYMEIDNLSIPYLSNVVTDNVDKQSFGLFAEISVANERSFNTVISNLQLNINEVISSIHNYVGGLAGKIDSRQENGISNSTQRIFLNNITINGVEGSNKIVQGRNAVGGLAGIAIGNVIIKNITSNINVNSSYDESKNSVKNMLYISYSMQTNDQVQEQEKSQNYKNISYAGGVIGIFDAVKVVDPATQRNYNASNIYVMGNNKYTGNIVGMAFGLVGSQSIVNYVNVEVYSSDSTKINASSYGGGIIGENRGVVISSSVFYADENNENNNIAISTYQSYNLFNSQYNSMAIGGLVGLNNGGIIYNSISSIFVRNINSTVAGGAVGRMIEGVLQNVIATGSVIGKSIIGGLIGTLNDIDILVDNNYNSLSLININDLIYEEITGSSLGLKTKALIANCVAGNNWLSYDYNYYENLLVIDKTAVSGFIGLISMYSSTDDFNESSLDKIEFRSHSYYSNTLYSNYNSYTNADKYLKASYVSKDLDYVNTNMIYKPLILKDSSGLQTVFPYSTSEFYYDSISTNVYYEIKGEKNPNYKISTTVEGDYYARKIYSIKVVNPVSLQNQDSFYKLIDMSLWNTEYQYRDYTWFINRFGKIYKNIEGQYVEIKNEKEFNDFYVANDDIYPNVYFISNINLDKLSFEQEYLYSTNDIILYGESDEVLIEFDTLEQLKAQTNVYLNGINFEIDFTNASASDESFVEDSVCEYVFDIKFNLPNLGYVSNISIKVRRNVGVGYEYYTIDSVKLTNVYENIDEISSISMDAQDDGNVINQYYGFVSNTDNIYTEFVFKILTKKLIYSAYNNNYWIFGDNFLSSSSMTMDKYPVNIELAENYIWTDFRSNKNLVDDDIDDDGELEKVYSITSAEDLSQLAYLVNETDWINSDILNGTINIEDVVITLNADIDLSGKYWVPIGTEDSPFRYKFEGNGYTIKYISVNKNSFASNGNVNYAGLFGVIQDAEICNLTIQGGEINWLNAGGLVGKAIDSNIYNIINRNNVNGIAIAGGIIGESQNSSIFNCINYADVSISQQIGINSSYIGGLVGKANMGNFGYSEGLDGEQTNFVNTNYGNLNISNNLNNYVVNDLYDIYAGGLIGLATDVKVGILDSAIETNNNTNNYHTNYGSINVNSNSHTLYVGGVIGYFANQNNLGEKISLYKLRNNGDINVVYSNIDSDVSSENVIDNVVSISAIGGVLGGSEVDFNKLANLGNINLDMITISDGILGVGGVAGKINNLKGQLLTFTENYNSANVNVSSTGNTTFGVGGIIGSIDLSLYDNSQVFEQNIIAYVKDSYNIGNITSNNNSQTSLGGIIGNVLTDDEYSKTIIQNTLNIGYATIYNIDSKQEANSLGAIIGNDNSILLSNPYANENPENPGDYVSKDLNNFYLRGSAYSGNVLYTALCAFNNGRYELVEDISTFAMTRISDNLKNLTTFISSVSSEDGEVEYVWDFDNVWTQMYDTWYPTLIDNNSTSYWEDKLEQVYSSTNYYQINSAMELSYIANQINTGKLDSYGKVFELTNYIDLSNNYWTPIGNEKYPFEGTFNGNNYTIKNLTIDGSIMSNNIYGGLFGYVENAVIQNINLVSPIIKNVSYAGALAYSVVNSKISYVYTEKGESNNSIIQGNLGAGGLIYLLKDSNYTVNNLVVNKGLYLSYNNVPVSRNTSIDTTCIVGGLVGSLENSLISNSYNSYEAVVTIKNVSGNVTLEGVTIAGSIDQSSDIENVFNISTMVNQQTESGETNNITPAIFEMKENDKGVKQLKIKETNYEPIFDNLLDSTQGIPEDLWTKEYSLNNDVNSKYPTIRGLGNDWKNTESEALVRFTVGNDFTKVRNEIQDYVSNTYLLVEDEQGQVVQSKIKTYLSFAYENLPYNKDDALSKVKINTIYLISTAEELAWLGNNVNNGNINTSNCEFILLNDIDLSGKYWTPIGLSRINSFKGIFNFNGHVISGLIIDSSQYNYAGLFGYTSNAYIINGYLDGAYIMSRNTNSDLYVGGIVGYSSQTDFRNIYVSTSIYAYSQRNVYVGGLAGYVLGNGNTISNINISNYKGIDLGNYTDEIVEVDSNGTIISSQMQSTDISIGAFSDGGEVYLGGAIGYVVGTQNQTGNSDLLEYLTTDIDIAAVSLSNANNVYAGGVVGYVDNLVNINASKTLGVIKTFSAKFDIIGGIVGYLNLGSINNCSFEGYVESRQRQSSDSQSIRSYLGGIVGVTEQGLINYSNSSLGSTIPNILTTDIDFGAIVGYVINSNTINSYSINVYLDSSNGFSSPLGKYDNSIVDETLLKSKFTTENTVITEENGFETLYWNNKNLLSKKTFVIGCGKQSFIASINGKLEELLPSDSDPNPGLLVSDLKEMILSCESISGQSKKSKIGIATVVSDGGILRYEYVEKELTQNTNILLSSFIDLDVDLITCYITLL